MAMKITALSLLVAGAALSGGCLQAHAAERVVDDVSASEARLRTAVSYELAAVKTPSQLASYLRRSGANTPLGALSSSARARFLESLRFNESGLAEYSYVDLQQELSASEAYGVLAIFGAEASAPFYAGTRIDSDIDLGLRTLMMAEDHRDAKCVSHGTCQTGWVGFICTSNC
jgi:hypothetical protein